MTEPKSPGLGKAMGVIMVRALEDAYQNGRTDAREEFNERVRALPRRTRTGVELVSYTEVLRIVEGLDVPDDGGT